MLLTTTNWLHFANTIKNFNHIIPFTTNLEWSAHCLTEVTGSSPVNRKKWRREAYHRSPEEKYIAGASCGYPSWTIRKVKKMRVTPKLESNNKDTQNTTTTLGQVNLPYVAGLTESFACLLKRHGIQSSMEPYNTLRQNLVHSKDKRPITDNAGVAYKITCQQYPKSYIGETEHRFCIRLKEH